MASEDITCSYCAKDCTPQDSTQMGWTSLSGYWYLCDDCYAEWSASHA